MDIVKKYLRPEISNRSWWFPAEERRFTVAELVERTNRYAAALTASGVGAGDAVGLITKNSSDMVCLLYACWYVNAVAVPLKTTAGKFERFEEYLRNCDAVCGFRLLLVDDDLILPTPPTGRHATTMSVGQLKGLKTVEVPPPADPEPEDIAIIQFSSGSTGRPKGVIVTHSMVMAQLANLDELFSAPVEGGRINCFGLWAPLNHDMGLFVGALSPIYHGADNLLAPPTYFMRNPVRWFKLLADHGVDVAMFTNASLAKSLPAIERSVTDARLDLRRCRIYLGAEKVSPVVVRESYRILGPSMGGNEHLYIGYGMAENGLGITTTPTGPIQLRHVRFGDGGEVRIVDSGAPDAVELASVGVPYRNNRVTIRDRHGRPLPDLTLGEIAVESHCLTPGYFNAPEKTAAVLREGRLYTGDLGFILDGELFFYARKDDLIIINGQNIVPDDVEMTVEEVPFLRPASTALFTIEDPASGIPKLCLLAETKGAPTKDEVKEQTATIGGYAYRELGLIINEIHLCRKGTIEKTSSGKKRRKIIKQRFIEQRTELVEGT